MELIDRDALLAAYDAAHKGPPGGARKLIEQVPTIDAVPVVHGCWELNHEKEWCCSACGYAPVVHEGSNYCGCCGAKMDLGETK